MPFKFNHGRRHKFERAKYSVANWSEHIKSLRRRGDLTGLFRRLCCTVSEQLGHTFLGGKTSIDREWATLAELSLSDHVRRFNSV